jgi:adenosylmethionine---8-amino-7-oxononanoate aminotransferase
LQIWDDEPVGERIGRIQHDLAELSPRLQRRTDVENVRQTGTILALDVRAVEAGYLSAVSPKLYRAFIASGVLLRPIGQSIYVLPPYCSSRAELEFVVARIESALDALAAGEL